MQVTTFIMQPWNERERGGERKECQLTSNSVLAPRETIGDCWNTKSHLGNSHTTARRPLTLYCSYSLVVHCSTARYFCRKLPIVVCDFCLIRGFVNWGPSVYKYIYIYILGRFKKTTSFRIFCVPFLKVVDGYKKQCSEIFFSKFWFLKPGQSRGVFTIWWFWPLAITFEPLVLESFAWS